MKESDVDADIKHETLRPTISEFANFANFVKNLERKGITFALVSNLFFYLLINRVQFDIANDGKSIIIMRYHVQYIFRYFFVFSMKPDETSFERF